MSSNSNQSNDNFSKLHKLTKTELVDMVLKLQNEKEEAKVFSEIAMVKNLEYEEDIEKLKKENKELLNAWLYYWSDTNLGKEADIPLSKRKNEDGISYQELLDGFDPDSSDDEGRVWEWEEQKKELKEEIKELKEDKQIIGLKEATQCFQNLGGNWWNDERICYSENFYDSDDEECEDVDDPDNIPTEKLKDGNYRDLRVLYDFFNDLN
jgi:hypothetical protein